MEDFEQTGFVKLKWRRQAWKRHWALRLTVRAEITVMLAVQTTRKTNFRKDKIRLSWHLSRALRKKRTSLHIISNHFKKTAQKKPTLVLSPARKWFSWTMRHSSFTLIARDRKQRRFILSLRRSRQLRKPTVLKQRPNRLKRSLSQRPT